ncbi:enoyl-CoA hydratase [Paraburkholderia oxyphila]|uniref:enoyl-CoA hydratase n=1 Tax=Paraburkholderia oxyphila TaxID=614212 RepID=UPI00047FD827|nr:enoyl-CoA hydratase [Paraburkholderia oxyphila]
MSDTQRYYELARDARDVVTLSIVNAGKMNIIGTPAITSLTEALARLAADRSVRAVILTGSGERAFVGGADLNEMVKLNPTSARAFIRRLRDLCHAVRTLPVPVIARIQGWCLGGGLELATACDLRIADAGSKFAMPEVKVGIPSVIHAALLPRLIGSGRTRWLLMTAQTIDARRALEWGFVDVVAEGSLDAEVEQAVADVLSCGPEVMRSQKALLNAWDEISLSAGVELSVDAFGSAFETGEPARYMGEFFARKEASKARQGSA